jgi:hypothetical protein
MDRDSTDQAIRLLVESGVASPRDFRGCTAQEIEQIEAAYQIHLPAVYVSLMTRMGRGAGQFMEGSDFLFPAPLTLRTEAERLLTESNAKFRLKNTDFVFIAHQGYQFLFFGTGASDDPPVFLYVEGDDQPNQVNGNFSGWLLAAVTDEIAAFKALHG